MKAKNVIAAAAMGAMILAGCSDSDVTGVNTDCTNLEGVFIANSAVVTSTSGTATTRNLLADSSAFNITFGTGTFSSSYRNGGSTTSRSGSISGSSPSSVTIGEALFPGSSSLNTYACSIDGDKLTLEATKSAFVFPGETDQRPASVRITLTRRPED